MKYQVATNLQTNKESIIIAETWFLLELISRKISKLDADKNKFSNPSKRLKH